VFSKKQYSLFASGICLAVGLSFAGANSAVAAERVNGWLDDRYPYSIIDQALADVLQELGRNLRVTVNISEGVKGRVRDYSHDGTSGDFLEHLQREYGLDWIIDGERLFVSAHDERVARFWPGDTELADQAVATLADAAFYDQRFPVNVDAAQVRFGLTAPPRYMALAASMIDRLMTPETTKTVNVIHGRSRDGGT